MNITIFQHKNLNVLMKKISRFEMTMFISLNLNSAFICFNIVFCISRKVKRLLVLVKLSVVQGPKRAEEESSWTFNFLALDKHQSYSKIEFIKKR